MPEGSKVVIREIVGSGHGLKRRLLEMGLTPGTEVEVLRNGWGPVIVRFRGSSVAIGRGMASKIIVEVVDHASSR